MKVKLLRTSFSRVESGERVTYKRGDIVENVDKNVYQSFSDNMKVLEKDTGQSNQSANEEENSGPENEEEFTEEELEKRNVTGEDGLRALASKLGISGYNNMKKKELIPKILEAQKEE